MPRLFQLISLLVSSFYTVHANPFCDENRYGKPQSIDCIIALSQIAPQGPYEKTVHYFVEEQMRTSPQSPAWMGFKDSRPSYQKQDLIQLPKWYAHGTCNVALYSFRHETQTNTAPPAQFARIYQEGTRIASVCIAGQRKGGAAIVQDEYDRPGLGIYMWADGANFQDVVNQELGDMFPYGMDPTLIDDEPMDLAGRIQNQTLPVELKVGNGNGSGFVEDLSPA